MLGNAPSLVLFAALFLFSTLGAFVLMNRYQKWVSASEAGVIYGMEPVFASLLALFMPELLSSFTAISYPNETLDARLLVGGGLVGLRDRGALLVRKASGARGRGGGRGERGHGFCEPLVVRRLVRTRCAEVW